jgi:hypothetical protein
MNSVVHFEENAREDEEIIDFQQHENEEENQLVGSKRKYSNDGIDDDASSTTRDLEGKNGTKETPNEKDYINIMDTSQIKSSEHINRDRISCSVPTFFSQQFSPISMKHSQLSESSDKISVERNNEQNTITSSQKENHRSPNRKSSLSKSNKEETLSSEDSLRKTKSRRSPRVSFQPRPKVMLLNASGTRKAADDRCIRKCIADGNITMLSNHPSDDDLDIEFDFDSESGRESFMKIFTCRREENSTPLPLSCYAISTDKDYSMSEGIVIPRSYRYYLAMACGLPIVDVGFLAVFSSKKRREGQSHQYPFPYSPSSSENKQGGADTKFRVIGASDYAWNAPQKAFAAAVDRHQSWLKAEGVHAESDILLPGTDLLHGYNIILLGDFDRPISSQRTAIRKKQNVVDMKKTRGNLSMLLQLCGARVYTVQNVTSMKHLKSGLNSDQCDVVNSIIPARMNSPTLKELVETYNIKSDKEKQDNPMVAVVKDSSSLKFAETFLSQYFAAATLPLQVPIVTSDWVFDCIGEHDLKKIS